MTTGVGTPPTATRGPAPRRPCAACRPVAPITSITRPCTVLLWKWYPTPDRSPGPLGVAPRVR